jgi:four helix bundle protein
MATRSFTELDVWKKADEGTNRIYDITELFPRHQLFSLTSQMQRAAYSVPSNIAEGYGRMYPKDKARLYNIAFSSTEELKYFLILSKRRGYRKDDPSLDQLVEDVRRSLRNLTASTLRNGGIRFDWE